MRALVSWHDYDDAIGNFPCGRADGLRRPGKGRKLRPRVPAGRPRPKLYCCTRPPRLAQPTTSRRAALAPLCCRCWLDSLRADSQRSSPCYLTPATPRPIKLIPAPRTPFHDQTFRTTPAPSPLSQHQPKQQRPATVDSPLLRLAVLWHCLLPRYSIARLTGMSRAIPRLPPTHRGCLRSSAVHWLLTNSSPNSRRVAVSSY